MRSRRLAGLALVVVVGGGLPGRARAQDAPAEASGSAVPSAGLGELRVYPLHALLRGHPVYRGDRGPYPARPDDVNDESRPLYVAEADDRHASLGGFTGSEELMEAIKSEVGPPDAWTREGTSLAAAGGDRLLVVQAPKDLQTGVAAWLDRATRDALRGVVVDVAAFRGEGAAGAEAGGVAKAVGRGAWTPLGVVRLTLHPFGTAVGRVGNLRAFVQDYDVEVAEDANTSDPIVGVAPEGLSVEATAVPSGGGSVSVRLRGWWAARGAFETRATREGDRVEVVSAQGAAFEGTVAAGDGAWVPLPGAGGFAFAARARVEAVPVAPAPAEGLRLSGADEGLEGDLAFQSYDLRDLLLPIAAARGRAAELWPSNYSPPKAPSLPEPAPPIGSDALGELLKAVVGPGPLEREGASLEVAGGACRARLDGRGHARVAAAVERLRADLLRTTRLRATFVVLPWASLPEWWAGIPDGLLADGAAALLARPGARVVGSAALRLREGERRASVSGAERSYVADFDVEIAKGSAIGNPITLTLLEGTSLDAEHDRAFGAEAACLGLRLDEARLLEVREVPTRHGAIECPVLAVHRTRGEVVVPWGATRLVAVGATGPEIRLVLLTANAE